MLKKEEKICGSVKQKNYSEHGNSEYKYGRYKLNDICYDWKK